MIQRVSFIYRVHHKDDVLIGMYNSAVVCAELQDMEGHPLPCNDALLSHVWDGTQYFGFGSKKQFAAWVYLPSIRVALTDEGYVISLFCANAGLIDHGEKQSICRPEVLGTSGMMIQQLPVSRWEELWCDPPKERMLRTLQSLGRME